jgi:acyl dehydratase
MPKEAVVGEVFSQSAVLTRDAIALFSGLMQDANPVHHSLEAALEAGFSDIIASGTQTSGLMMGAIATYFSKNFSMLGLEFNMKFRRPVLANLEYEIKWRIVSVVFKPSLHGSLVRLEGQFKSTTEVCVVSSGTVLIK